MSDALEVLRAAVEAVEAALQTPFGLIDYDDLAGDLRPLLNLAKRLCTDEGVEQIASAVIEAVHESGAVLVSDLDLTDGRDMTRAAIRAILGEQP